VTHRLAAGLLLAWLSVAASGRGDVVTLPDMPPQRLDSAEAAVLLEHRPTTTVVAGATAIGFVLSQEGNAYAGAYLLDPRTGAYEEVGAWRGELVGPCTADRPCDEGVATLVQLVAATYARQHAAVDAAPPPAPTEEAVATPTPAAEPAAVPQPGPSTTAAAPPATTAAVAPAAPAPAPRPSPLPPLLSLEGMLERVAQHPVTTGVSLLALVLVVAVLRSPTQAALPAPSVERVVITHEEHERAAARLQERLLADKAKLERLSSELEAEESKLIARVSHLTKRL